MRISSRAWRSTPDDPRLMSSAAAAAGRAHPLLDQRHERGAAIGREVEPIERGRQDFWRRRLEVEEQTDRLRQIHVREVAQHLAVGIAVEQTGQDRSLQQVVAAIRVEIQHRPRELAEHDLRQPGIERREQSRDVAVLPLERGLLCVGSTEVVVGQPHEHRRDVGGIVDEHDEIEERDLRQPSATDRCGPSRGRADRDS